MPSPSYLRALENAFHEASCIDTAYGQEAYLQELMRRDSGLAAEVRMMLTLQGEAEEVLGFQQSELLSLLNTTLGEPKRGESLQELFTFLSQVSESTDAGGIGTLRGYKLKKLIATGPTGLVLQGIDPHLRRDVAIKVLAPSIATSPVRRNWFIEEARLTSTVRNPHVVSIYQIISDADLGLVFYVMEWLQGHTLQVWLDNQRTPSLQHSNVKQWIAQLASGIDAIHAHGIVHRDLKPDNLIVTPTETHITIVDFGLALEKTHRQSEIPLAGTPLYMSPEQMLNTDISYRSDLFSFAEIVCVLLYGQHPFESHSLTDLTELLLQCKPRLPSESTGCSQKAQSVLKKALARAPEDRFGSASEFVHELFAPSNTLELSKRSNGLLSGPEQEHSSPSTTAVARTTARPTLIAQKKLSVFAILAALSLFSLWIIDWSLSPERQVSRSPLSTEGATAPQPRRAAWEDSQHFRNFLGMHFVRISPPDLTSYPWPLNSEHPELFVNLGWKNIEKDMAIGTRLVTWRQYLQVMDEADTSSVKLPNNLTEPATQVTCEEAEEFCRRLTARDPDGLRYTVCSNNSWTMAVYGQKIARERDAYRKLDDAFRALSLGKRRNSFPIDPFPAIDDIFGTHWEWTPYLYRKTPILDGVVSYRQRPEIPAVPITEAMGGGSTDLFVHAHDMQFGMNDFLSGFDNIEFHQESDGETCYLRPSSFERPAYVRYRYSFPQGVINSSVQTPFQLYQAGSIGGIRLRVLSGDSKQSSESKDWQSVFEVEAPYFYSVQKVDLTRFVKNATQIEIEYWVKAESEPLYEVQLGRTTADKQMPNVFQLDAVMPARLESMRQTVRLPKSFRSPLVGFRVEITSTDSNPFFQR